MSAVLRPLFITVVFFSIALTFSSYNLGNSYGNNELSQAAFVAWKDFDVAYFKSMSVESTSTSNYGGKYVQTSSMVVEDGNIRLVVTGLMPQKPNEMSAFVVNRDYGFVLIKESTEAKSWGIQRVLPRSSPDFLANIGFQEGAPFANAMSPLSEADILFSDLVRKTGFRLVKETQMDDGLVKLEFSYIADVDPKVPRFSNELSSGHWIIDPENSWLPVSCAYTFATINGGKIVKEVKYDYGDAIESNKFKLPVRSEVKTIHSPKLTVLGETNYSWQMPSNKGSKEFRLPSFGLPEPDWIAGRSWFSIRMVAATSIAFAFLSAGFWVMRKKTNRV